MPNIEFDFDACVDSRNCLTDTSRSNSTLGTLSGKCPEGFFLELERGLNFLAFSRVEVNEPEPSLSISIFLFNLLILQALRMSI